MQSPMTSMNLLRNRLQRSFALYRDLIEGIDSNALDSKLPGVPSNTIGRQLWCVIGARESYAQAIEAGEWSGFACSLKTTTDQQAVANALRDSETAVLTLFETTETFTDAQLGFILDLLEHEAAHQGQLIRYLYGLRLTIPESWKTRYALT